MAALGRRSIAVAVVCIGVLVQAQDCGKVQIVYREYGVQSCSADSLALPDSVLRPPYQMVAVRHADYPACSGSKVYRLFERGYDRGLFDVVIDPGGACRLGVVYAYLGHADGRPSGRAEEQLNARADAVAGLVVGGAGATASTAGVRTERFNSQAELDARCARASPPDSAQSPM